MSLLVNGYFGVKWNAPAFENAVEFPCPEGEKCLLCNEKIVAGESGVMMGYVDEKGDGGVAPQHIECFLRSIFGSVAHLELRCSCHDTAAPTTTTRVARSYRSQARETMEWLLLHGG